MKSSSHYRPPGLSQGPIKAATRQAIYDSVRKDGESCTRAAVLSRVDFLIPQHFRSSRSFVQQIVGKAIYKLDRAGLIQRWERDGTPMVRVLDRDQILRVGEGPE